jgi:hypothetical protein
MPSYEEVQAAGEELTATREQVVEALNNPEAKPGELTRAAFAADKSAVDFDGVQQAYQAEAEAG